MALLSLESGELSDIGKKRSENEDSCFSDAKLGVFCIADGMGGMSGGDIASEAIVSAIQESLASGDLPSATLEGRFAQVATAINDASRWIKAYSDEKHLGQMGSTVVALVFDVLDPSRAIALHAGDSRLYRYRSGALVQLTQDHSAEAALAQKYGCAPEDIPARFQNRLLRAVGLKVSTELERTDVTVQAGDEFILCSDGLSRMVPDEAIGRVLGQGRELDPAALTRALVDLANEAGGRDNVTVIVVRSVSGGTPGNIPPSTPCGSAADQETILLESVDKTPHSATAEGETSESRTLPQGNALDGSLHSTTELPGSDVDSDAAPEPPVPIYVTAKPSRQAAPEEPASEEGDPVDSELPRRPAWPSLSWIGASIAVAACATAMMFHWIDVRKTGGQELASRPSEPTPMQAGGTVLGIPAFGGSPVASGFPEALRLSQQFLAEFRFESAVREAQRARDLNPGDPGATQLLSAARRAMEDHAAALRSTAELLRTGSCRAALEAANQALEKFPAEPRLLTAQSNALLRVKRLDVLAELSVKAREASGRRDFDQALALVRQAEMLVPGEREVAALRSQVEEAQRRYAKVVAETLEAFQAGRYEDAKRIAVESQTVFPGDPVLLKLREDSEALLTRSDRYATAMQSARDALGRGDWVRTRESIEAALAARPNDSQARTLKQELDSRLAAAKSDRSSQAEARDVETAQGGLNAGNYELVDLAFARFPASESLSRIKTAADAERIQLQVAHARLASGDYSWFEVEDRRELLSKPRFAPLAAAAREEHQWLGELLTLKAKNDVAAVRSRLSGNPYSALLEKAPFAELRLWSAQSSDRASYARLSSADLQEINLTFQRLLVRYAGAWEKGHPSFVGLVSDPELRKALERARASDLSRLDKGIPRDPARFVADLQAREDLEAWRSASGRSEALEFLRAEISRTAK